MICLLKLEQVGLRRTRVHIECDGRPLVYCIEQLAPAPGIIITSIPDGIYEELDRYAWPVVEGKRCGATTIPAISRLQRIVEESWTEGAPQLPIVVARAPPGWGDSES